MSTISASTTSTTAYKVTADTTGTLVLQTGATPTTAMTIDGSQNVGIGAVPTVPSAGTVLEMVNGSTLYSRSSAGVPQFYISSNAVGTGYSPTYKVNGYATQYVMQGYDGTHSWYGAASGTAGNAITWLSRMMLDSSGNLLLGGTTSAGAFKQQVYLANLATNNGILVTNGSNTTGGAFAAFQNYVGTIIGQISQATSTTVNYATSSDYRLKDNVQPMTGALSTIAQLKPCTYTWKLDDSAGQGFIAHELAEVCPEAVVGEKDAVDADGNPKYQGIDTSFLVATLTAAIQELKAELDAAKADIATLKGAA